MKNIFWFLSLALVSMPVAQAEVLSPRVADSLCRISAVNSAHFMAQSDRKFFVTYRASEVAEISTKITYQFRYANQRDSRFTVVAYAYPDTANCLIGQITDNFAGND